MLPPLPVDPRRWSLSRTEQGLYGFRTGSASGAIYYVLDVVRFTFVCLPVQYLMFSQSLNGTRVCFLVANICCFYFYNGVATNRFGSSQNALILNLSDILRRRKGWYRNRHALVRTLLSKNQNQAIRTFRPKPIVNCLPWCDVKSRNQYRQREITVWDRLFLHKLPQPENPLEGYLSQMLHRIVAVILGSTDMSMPQYQ